MLLLLFVVHEVVHGGAELAVKLVLHASLLDQLDELAGLSCVLTGNNVTGGQCLVLAERKIAKVTYWGRDYDK